MRLRLVKEETKIDFFRFTPITCGISAAAVVASVVLFFVLGLNYGIDFRGGSMITTQTPEEVAIGEYREVLSDLDIGDVTVTAIFDPAAELGGAPENYSAQIRIEQQDGDPAIQNETVMLVQTTLTDAFPTLIVLSSESVGAKVSGELVTAGIIAVSLAIAVILFYIWLRFEWQFSVGAVAALVHDVVLTIGVFALVGLEFNLAIVAAILTIVGYSLNDTVVVFDRVRENLKRYKKTPLNDVMNLSINETLSRTLMTSVTTLLALLVLYFLGGDVIRGFTFAMIWGVLVGTYSSVFVASAILLRLDVKRDWSKPEGGAGTQFANVDA
jgi:preprotein translocase subunit SecF